MSTEHIAIILLGVSNIFTFFGVMLLYMRVNKTEQLLHDVSLDITMYEQLKTQKIMRGRKPINKVGTWKK